MAHAFSRTEMLFGKENMQKLYNATVMVVGVGGVGSYVSEGLCRAGVGNIVLVDDDEICLTNLNRQLHATNATIGKPKVDVMKDRILSINPDCNVTAVRSFLTAENMAEIVTNNLDFIVDAIDTVSAKIALCERAKQINVPIVMCLGTGNKVHPEMLQIADISKTSVCPLAKVMRQELRKRKINHVDVCFSTEQPIVPLSADEQKGDSSNSDMRTGTAKRSTPGSTSFVPPVAGMILAGHVIRKITGIN